MKRLLTILLFFVCLAVNGQYPDGLPTTNLVFFTDTIEFDTINGKICVINELTGIGDTNIYLYNIDFPLIENRIYGKSAAMAVLYSKDTISVVCLNGIPDYNLADSFFVKSSDHVLNSDSTELYGYGITEIAYYLGSLTGDSKDSARTYFDVDSALTGVIVVGVEETYTTIAAAIEAASAGDTIYIKEGTYNQGSTSININKEISLIGIGSVKINSSASNIILLNANNINIHNLYIDSEGTANIMYMASNRTGINIGNNYLKNTNGTYIINFAVPGYGCNFYRNYIADAGSYGFMLRSYFYPHECVFKNANVIFRNNYDNLSAGMEYCDFYGSVVFGRATTTTLSYTKITSKYNRYFIFTNLISAYDVDTLTMIGDTVDMIGAGALVNYLTSTMPSHGYYSISNCGFYQHNSVNDLMAVKNKDFYLTNSYLRIDSSSGFITVTGTNDYNNIIFDVEGNIFKSGKEYAQTAISFGDDTFVDKNTVKGNFVYNKILGPRLEGSNPSFSHGICLWAIDSVECAYNYIDGTLFPFVLKSDSSDYSHVKIHHNIWKNGRLIVKGVDSTKIFNNTAIIDDSVNTALFVTAQTESGAHSNGTDLVNNIFVNFTPVSSILTLISADYLFEPYIGETFNSQNNIFFNLNGYIFKSEDDYYTWNEWKSLGFDENSFNTDPNFYDVQNNKFWPVNPSNAIGKGYNLGSTYQTGLDITSSWPGSIVTKEQIVPWTIGAYVIYKYNKGIQEITGIKVIE